MKQDKTHFAFRGWSYSV